MPIQNFDEFQAAFFTLFETPQFGGKTFLDYLTRDKSERSGDEASIVDNVLSGPLLSLLGFADGEQRYNAVKTDLSRPDFAPRVPDAGDCFVIEDKATPLLLEAKWREQLAGYVRGSGVRLGLLSNGGILQLWEFGAKESRQLFELDIAAWLELRKNKKPIPEKWERDLESLFDLLRREAFTSAHSLAEKLSVDAQTWREQAQKLGADPQIEDNLVSDLRELVGAMHAASLIRISMPQPNSKSSCCWPMTLEPRACISSSRKNARRLLRLWSSSLTMTRTVPRWKSFWRFTPKTRANCRRRISFWSALWKFSTSAAPNRINRWMRFPT